MPRCDLLFWYLRGIAWFRLIIFSFIFLGSAGGLTTSIVVYMTARLRRYKINYSSKRNDNRSI